ncbi:hypothetical protein EDD86DRAFT_229504 [Gorgonomyces haynaldii]|nr:hypothetical protein EDD86DRAFT_229504 [Gorgonomyces haynaldii]
MACCDSADWKREEIPDHKFDHIDVDEFYDPSFPARLSYASVFLMTLKSILVYFADLGSVALLIATVGFNNLLSGQVSDVNVNIAAGADKSKILLLNVDPIVQIGLIFASVVASFILLFFEWRKAMRIIKSRDISYAFTSTIAYRWYAIRSYPHYCLFSQIQNSRKTTDLLAFYCYFRFRGWKRLIFAEGPRQFFNLNLIVAVTRFILNFPGKPELAAKASKSIPDFFSVMWTSQNGQLTTVNYGVLLLTFSIWTISFLSLFVAFLIYIPLLCIIRGNLKEYCVHKIDKRIGEILKRKSRRKLQEARRAEREMIGQEQYGVKPTLPNVNVDLSQRADQMSDYGSQYRYAYPAQGPPSHPRAPGSHYSDNHSDFGDHQTEFSYGSGQYVYHQTPQQRPYYSPAAPYAASHHSSQGSRPRPSPNQ